MTPQALALALVLAAAVCHATWNLLAKKAGGSGNAFVLLSSLLHGCAVADLTVVYPVARGSGPLLSCAACAGAG